MKKIICLVLAVLMICALMACNSAKTSDIDELQQKITELQEQLKDQSDKNDELKELLKQQKEVLEGQLAQKDKQIKDLEENVDYLELEAKGIKGTFTLMRDRYVYDEDPNGKLVTLPDRGVLTREDFMHIVYFATGSVWQGDPYDSRTWKKIEFEPQIKKPELSDLPEQVVNDIKSTLMNTYNHNEKHDWKITSDDIEILEYYGCYNGSYVLVYHVYGYETTDDVKTIHFGDICFGKTIAPEVFRYFDCK